MSNLPRLVAGLVVVIGLGCALRYIYDDTMTKATTMKPADLGINEANGWKPVEFMPVQIDTSPMKSFDTSSHFPSKR